jgi:hypothetical protein
MLAAIVIELTDWKYDEIDWLSSTEFSISFILSKEKRWYILVLVHNQCP